MRLLPIDNGVAGVGEGDGTRLGFGCASLGDVPGYTGKCKVIEAAYEAGFRHFDVAPSYGHGEAEAVLATVLAGVRARVSIVSKVGIAHPKGGDTMKRLRRAAAPIKRFLPSLWGAASRKTTRLIAPAGRFGPAQMEASVCESLRRLGCDSLDALLLHEVGEADLTAEALAMLDKLSSQGLLGALGTGTSVDTTQRIVQLHPGRFEVLQVNHYWGSRTPALTLHGATAVTHRSIRTGLELLERPAFRHTIESHARARELSLACADRRFCGDLLLVAALRLQHLGMVLVSTSKPARVGQLVALAGRLDLVPLADAMNECLDRVALETPEGARAPMHGMQPTP